MEQSIIISLNNVKVNKVILMSNGKSFLSLTHHDKPFFVYIPKEITISISETHNLICQFSKSNSAIYKSFYYSLTSIISNQSNKLYKKKLLLKGLGFRFALEDNNVLVFKLGFSHVVSLKLPSYIVNIKLKKNILLLESTNKVLLGNFVKKIESLRPCDPYKEKGFCLSNVKLKFKPVKKK